jgi:hypothetical protein
LEEMQEYVRQAEGQGGIGAKQARRMLEGIWSKVKRPHSRCAR